jgi:hypothetical protein
LLSIQLNRLLIAVITNYFKVQMNQSLYHKVQMNNY